MKRIVDFRNFANEPKKILGALTLSLLMLHICGVSQTFGEWYQKTNKKQDTNKLTYWPIK
jgi:hypothetical protein